jgi:hypothetical protein
MAGNELIGNTLGMVMNLSLTVVGISILFGLLAGYFWTRTKGKAVSLSLGIVFASVVYQSLMYTPLYEKVFSQNMGGFLLGLGVFGALVFLSTRITHSYVHGKFISETPKRLAHVSLLAASTLGVVVSIAYELLGIESFYNLSNFADFLYGSPYSLLTWVVGLFLVLFLIRTRR